MSKEAVSAEPEVIINLEGIFNPASWLVNIEFINHLILFNHVMISVLGDQGSGKTTFLKLLQTNLNTQIQAHVLTATVLFNRSALLNQLKKAFELADDVQDVFGGILERVNARKAYEVLIIDDAHYLPDRLIDEMLQALHQQGDKGFFRVCFVSSFSLVPTLNKLAATSYENLIHSIELGPLNESETKTYVLRRLASQKGYEKMLTEERLHQFYQLTEGHLVGINSQMLGFFKKRKGVHPAAASLIRFSFAATVILAISGSAYYWQTYQETRTQQELTQVGAAIATQAATVIPQTLAVLASQVPSLHVASTRQLIQTVPLRKTEQIAYDPEQENAPQPIMDKVVVVPKTIVPQAVAHATKVPTAASKAVMEVKPKATLAKAKKGVISKRIISGEGGFTVQLLASSGADELKRFAQHHKIHDKAQIYRIQNRGNAWYVLTLGKYKDRNEAKQAIHQLSTELAKFKPWVRSTVDLG